MAVHYWFVVNDGENRCDRWEVWQNKDTGGISWGHLHQNIMPIYNGVGNGESWQEYVWEGENAQRLTGIIEESKNNYPYCNIYRYFPGPNSNTYVAWVLNQAKINYELGIKGIGKSYPF
ncbi:DUF3750 domain-containing protein [Cyanobacterium stanieri LEGE 03274]|uniref:DUF3750 domain-containing protein n=2 Tax=Cyanobacterium TaxID=102234 RepID=A0ABR9V549_9CHRO|nr:DUF3750 domain-containing protein [Cyanobacterium stanieri LEGE 03274]